MVRKRPEMLLREDPTHCECGVRLDVHPPLPDIKLKSWRDTRPKLSHATQPARHGGWSSVTVVPSRAKQRAQENEQERKKRSSERNPS